MAQYKWIPPFRIEESTKKIVPEHFQQFIESVLTDRGNLVKSDKSVLETFDLENDYAICVLVTVALECGFRLDLTEDKTLTKNFDVRVSREVTFSSKWRDIRQRLYKVDLYLPDLKNHRFLLLVVPILSNSLLVNILTFSKDVIVRSTVEPLIPSQWLCPFQSTIAERFISLPRLARDVRWFFQKEKDLALNAVDICNPSLLGLPDELKRCIFRFLKVRDFLNLTVASKKLVSYAKDLAVWKHYLKRDFNMDSEEPYDMYVSKHCSSKDPQPMFQEYTDHLFPMMLHRTTSSTSLQEYLHML